MRYPAAETAEKHQRIIEEASRLFRERGFNAVSVGEIMKETGLTHGPFYNHFASKEALMAESIEHASARAAALVARVSESAESREEAKRAYVEYYLGEKHRDTPGDGCLVAALASDIGRQPAIKSLLTRHLKSSFERLASVFPWSSKKRARSEAIRAMAAMVGAVILARAVDDPELSAEILGEVKSGLIGSADR